METREAASAVDASGTKATALASWTPTIVSIVSFDLIDALDEGMTHIVDAFSAEVPAVERIETVAEVLKLFLRGLTDGIITTSLWSRIEQASLVSLGQGAAASSKIPPQETAYEQDKGTVLDILSTVHRSSRR